MLLQVAPWHPVCDRPRRARGACFAATSGSLEPPYPLRPLHDSLRHATPGVYLVYDGSGAVAFTGMSRNVQSSLLAHTAALDSSEASTAAVLLLPGATSAQLQAAWRSVVAQYGVSPSQSDPKWTTKPSRAALGVADVDAQRWAQPSTAALLADATQHLLTRGYAVVDAALPADTVASAAAACAVLAGALRATPSQVAGGRRDRSAGLKLKAPGVSQVATMAGGVATEMRPGVDASALAAAAALLYSIPSALAGQPQFGDLAPPQLLQLGLYDAANPSYARHVDAPPTGSPGADEGPRGWRTSDRVLTALLYLNPGYDAAQGGQLRLWPRAGDPAFVDVAPLGGRLLLFDSAAVGHEVLPVHSGERWALSAWFMRKGAFDGA
jgi:hypothetical protein